MNKLGANMQCISSAEKLYTGMQGSASSSPRTGAVEAKALAASKSDTIDLAAG
jgi:hypothetical protein